MDRPAPHRSGPSLRAGRQPAGPVIFTGPLTLHWQRRPGRLPRPRIEDGALTAKHPLDLARLHRWERARIGIGGRPDWVFAKLYCHGFFPSDESAVIGERMRRFLEEVLDYSQLSKRLKIHFVTCREAFNIAMAAVDGCEGDPGLYRNHRLRPILGRKPATTIEREPDRNTRATAHTTV